MNDRLSLSVISMYYTLMGVDLNKVNIEEIYSNGIYLSDVSPLKFKNIIIPQDELSLELDLDINFFLERVFGTQIHLDKKYEYKFEREYIVSVMRIINTISKLKLIKEKSNNYILEFQRMSYLLHIAFSEINTKTLSMPKDLSKLIEQKNYDEIKKFMNMCPNLTLLLLLVMRMSNDDYKIFFTDDSYRINFAKVLNVLKEVYEISPHFKSEEGSFSRMPYDRVLKLTRWF